MKKYLVAIILLSSVLIAGHPAMDALVKEAIKETGEITPKELKILLDGGKTVLLLDVREIEQRSEGEIPSNYNLAITRGSLEGDALNKIKDKQMMIVTFCRTGWRGALGAQTMKKLGFSNVKNLKGGIKAWAETGYPVETGMGTFKMTGE